jgi:hypothetical protein
LSQNFMDYHLVLIRTRAIISHKKLRTTTDEFALNQAQQAVLVSEKPSGNRFRIAPFFAEARRAVISFDQGYIPLYYVRLYPVRSENCIGRSVYSSRKTMGPPSNKSPIVSHILNEGECEPTNPMIRSICHSFLNQTDPDRKWNHLL